MKKNTANFLIIISCSIMLLYYLILLLDGISRLSLSTSEFFISSLCMVIFSPPITIWMILIRKMKKKIILFIILLYLLLSSISFILTVYGYARSFEILFEIITMRTYLVYELIFFLLHLPIIILVFIVRVIRKA